MKSRAQRYRYVRHVVSGTRPSPWSPLSLGSSLAAWYRADAGCYTDAACLFASASSQYLIRTGAEAVLRGSGSGFWRAIWVKTSTAGLQIPVDMRVSNDQGYRISLTLGGNAAFGVGDGASSVSATVAAPSSGAWALLYGDFDGTTVRVSKNAGSFGTAAFSGSYSDPVGQDLNVGRDGVGALVYFDGAIGRFCGGNGKLSDAQITALYNAGAGLFCADLPADIRALTGFSYNLCEASSTRVDSVGALNLTPTNGPTVAAGPGEGLATNNSPVKRWESRYGVAHLLQATIAKQPLWLDAIQNGRPVLRFDGVDDYIKAVGFTLNQPEDIYFAGRYVTAPSAFNETVIDGNAANLMRVYGVSATQIRLYAGSAGPTLTPTGITAFHAYRALFNGASSLAAVDDGANATGDCGASNGGGLALGSYGTGSAGFSNSEIGELFVASAAAPVPATPKAYLKSRWATP